MTKLAELKAGDVVVADDGFTCLPTGPHTVYEWGGLYVNCNKGRHYLTHDDGELIGFRKEQKDE